MTRWLIVVVALLGGCERKVEPAPRHSRSGDRYLMVLREGEDAFAQLAKLATDEKIPGATFEGFGFGHATFGYFDAQKKDYDRHEVRDVELASLRGSIAWQNGAPSVHAHAVAADRSFAAQGGHLLGFQVGKGSLELEIVIYPAGLARERDEALGANVLVLPR
jgi:predicted DNA-binding protein with PD1-like motif